ncbi:Os11g0613500 [Oryza sativa Japonica Group]|uniref:Expressed protein n=2 Tax=Oryza TaxID=4527 RepID=Q2R1A3_ORYSJ|nr:expressed protein [Oryza sativa Japonica Group]BAT14845.1 Os11g0613500 [Oryza sativa Japonica Group]
MAVADADDEEKGRAGVANGVLLAFLAPEEALALGGDHNEALHGELRVRQGHEVDAGGDDDDEAWRGEVRAPQGRAYDDDAAEDEEGLRFLPGRARYGVETRGFRAEDVGDEGCRGQGHEVDAAGDADDEARRGEVRAPQGRAYDDDAAEDEEGLRFLPGRALGEEVRGVLPLRDRALRLRRDRMGYDDEGDVLRLQARGDAEDDEGLLRRRAHGEGLPLPAFGVSGERRPLGGRARLYYDANDDYQGLRGRARYGVETRGFCAEDVGDEGRRGRAHDDGHERHRGRGRVGGERQSSCANDDDQGLRGGAHDDPDEPRRGRVLLTLRARLKDDDDEELMRDQEGALGDEVHRGANGYREGHRSAHDDGEGPPFAALDDGEERPLGGLVEELFVCRLGDDDEVRVGANHNGEGRRLRGPRPDGEEARVRCGRAYQLAPRAHAQEEPRVRRDRAQEDEEEPPVRRGRARSPLRLQARGDAEDGEGLPFRLRAHGEGLPLPGLGVGGRARLYGEGLGREDDAERLEVAVDDAEGGVDLGALELQDEEPAGGKKVAVSAAVAAARAVKNAAGKKAAKEAMVRWGQRNPNKNTPKKGSGTANCSIYKEPVEVGAFQSNQKIYEPDKRFMTGNEVTDSEYIELVGLYNKMNNLQLETKDMIKGNAMRSDILDNCLLMRNLVRKMRSLRAMIKRKVEGEPPIIPPNLLEIPDIS